jgi:CRISPR/Cas system-associated endonuclease Cas3-HD
MLRQWKKSKFTLVVKLSIAKKFHVTDEVREAEENEIVRNHLNGKHQILLNLPNQLCWVGDCVAHMKEIKNGTKILFGKLFRRKSGCV